MTSDLSQWLIELELEPELFVGAVLSELLRRNEKNSTERVLVNV